MQCLVGKCGNEVVRRIFEHVNDVNIRMLCFWLEDVHCSWCDSVRQGKYFWLLGMRRVYMCVYNLASGAYGVIITC